MNKEKLEYGLSKTHRCHIYDYKQDPDKMTVRRVRFYNYNDELEASDRILKRAKRDIDATKKTIQRFLLDKYDYEDDLTEGIIIDIIDGLLDHSAVKTSKPTTTTAEVTYFKVNLPSSKSTACNIVEDVLTLNVIDTTLEEHPIANVRKRFNLEAIIKDVLKLSLPTTHIRSFKLPLDEWVVDFGEVQPLDGDVFAVNLFNRKK